MPEYVIRASVPILETKKVTFVYCLFHVAERWLLFEPIDLHSHLTRGAFSGLNTFLLKIDFDNKLRLIIIISALCSYWPAVKR